MLRALGSPRRVAVGFASGSYNSGELYQVTTQNAHSWVEVRDPGLRMARVGAPRPTRDNPIAQAYGTKR